MARPMGFGVRAVWSSRKMLDTCHFSVLVCIAASASAMNTTSRPIGRWTFGSRRLCATNIDEPVNTFTIDRLVARRVIIAARLQVKGGLVWRSASHKRIVGFIGGWFAFLESFKGVRLRPGWGESTSRATVWAFLPMRGAKNISGG
jgi:hypothetical protein